MTTSEFTISGLHCDSCLKLVPMLLGEINGVTDVQISGMDGMVKIAADHQISADEVTKSLEGTDYKIA
ncbi:MAG: heavy-metal-associated domain-containing protein [Patescibacteria group bacterium]|nr:heavy-metal-associated domain-containing protein [Patescibacteria group bacterium]